MAKLPAMPPTVDFSLGDYSLHEDAAYKHRCKQLDALYVPLNKECPIVLLLTVIGLAPCFFDQCDASSVFNGPPFRHIAIIVVIATFAIYILSSTFIARYRKIFNLPSIIRNQNYPKPKYIPGRRTLGGYDGKKFGFTVAIMLRVCNIAIVTYVFLLDFIV